VKQRIEISQHPFDGIFLVQPDSHHSGVPDDVLGYALGYAKIIGHLLI
jgi:hypothetical protein